MQACRQLGAGTDTKALESKTLAANQDLLTQEMLKKAVHLKMTIGKVFRFSCSFGAHDNLSKLEGCQLFGVFCIANKD